MSDSKRKRPSDFELSRWILGESSGEQIGKINRWLASGEDAARELDAFRRQITLEERNAPPLPALRRLAARRKASGTPPVSLLRQPVFICTVFAGAMLAVCALLFTYRTNHRKADRCITDTATISDTVASPASFQDSLELLLHISESLLTGRRKGRPAAEEHTSEVCSTFDGNSVAFRGYSPAAAFPADRTAGDHAER